MNWNWDHLRFFLSLANNGTLTDAAKELGVSHSTVLRRIKAFEQELETHLFDHTSSGYNLTPAGVSLHKEVQKMKHSVDDIARQIAGADQQIEGPVVITTTDTLGFVVMPDILKSLLARYPELQVTLNIDNTESNISDREADIAIRICAKPPPQLIGRKIGPIGFAACASTSYAEENSLTTFPDDTSNYRYIVLNSAYRELPFHQWFAERLASTSSITVVNGFLTAYKLCQEGLGISVLPSYLVANDPTFRCLQADSPIATNDIWLLSHVDLRDTVRVRLVRKFIYDALISCDLMGAGL